METPNKDSSLQLDVALIVAQDFLGNIGWNNQLLWRCKEDMQWFREKTTGHVVVMGRKTFESMMSKPLKNRVNIVISSTLEQPEDNSYYVVPSPAAAVAKYVDLLLKEGQKTLFVIGGGKIYKELAVLCTTLYRTLFHVSCIGDTKLQDLDVLGTGSWVVSFKQTKQLDVQFTPGVQYRKSSIDEYRLATVDSPKEVVNVTFTVETRK